MGLGEIIKVMFKGKPVQVNKGQKQKCPSCGEALTLDMERCPKCGVHVKSMFRRKCPKCKTLNELDNKRCSQCAYDFEGELEGAKRDVYSCPICGYRSDAYLTRCPVCNTRFM